MKLGVVSGMLATWVGIAAAITGGYAALQQYREDVGKRLDERQLQTFELIRTFTSRDFVPIRDKVTRLVQSRQVCANENMQTLGLSTAELSTFVEFFDLVSACLDANLCDAAIADRFFVPQASANWPVLQGLVLEARKEQEPLQLPVAYGSGLERLARNAAPLTACP
ncbi:MAG: hypothetical protein R3D33_14895 [Hyphomicrobiaceae bacterium]